MPAYQDKETKRWRYRFYRAGIRYSGSTPKGGNTKRVAEQLEKEHINRIGEGVDEEIGLGATFSKVIPRFLRHQAQRTKPLTQKQQRQTLVVHIEPLWGSKRVTDLRKTDIDDLITRWKEEGYESSTVNSYLAHVKKLLKFCLDRHVISKAPKIERLKLDDDHPRFLSDDEAHRLVEAIGDDDWRSMAFVAIRTGLRIGELRGLRWPDVDLERMTVTVRRTAPGLAGYEPTSPKSKSQRSVPLSPDSADMLRAHRDKYGSVGYVWPAKLGKKRLPEVVRSEGGCFHAMTRYAEKAGIADCTWHTLRHTYASWLVMRGANLREIQRNMGHHSVTQTEKYAHLTPEFGHEKAALLDLPMAARSGQPAAKLQSGAPEEQNLTKRLASRDR